jgi:hypothetical protein
MRRLVPYIPDASVYVCGQALHKAREPLADHHVLAAKRILVVLVPMQQRQLPGGTTRLMLSNGPSSW